MTSATTSPTTTPTTTMRPTAETERPTNLIYIIVSVIGAFLLLLGATFLAYRYSVIKRLDADVRDDISNRVDAIEKSQIYDSTSEENDIKNGDIENLNCESAVNTVRTEMTKTLYDPSAPSHTDICFINQNQEEASDNIVEATAIVVEQYNNLSASLNEKTKFFKQLDNESKFLSKEAYTEFKKMFEEQGITDFGEFLLCDNGFYEKIFGLLKTIPAKRFRDCFLSS